MVPYSATQFVTFDYCKSAVASYTGRDQPTIVERLACGACAGICASFATHPLDVIRTRLAVQAELKGIAHTVTTLWGEGGVIAMYKGLGPTLASLAPFVAINFAAYDTLKAHFFPGGSMPQGPLYSLGMGASAGIIAQVAAVECASRPLACLSLSLISSHAPPCLTPATCWRSLARHTDSRRRPIPTSVSLPVAHMCSVGVSVSVRPHVFCGCVCERTVGRIGMHVHRKGTASKTDARDFAQSFFFRAPVIRVCLSSSLSLTPPHLHLPFSATPRQTACYPLDTIRRRMQLKGKNYKSTLDAIRTIILTEGSSGLYRGICETHTRTHANPHTHTHTQTHTVCLPVCLLVSQAVCLGPCCW